MTLSTINEAAGQLNTVIQNIGSMEVKTQALSQSVEAARDTAKRTAENREAATQSATEAHESAERSRQVMGESARNMEEIASAVEGATDSVSALTEAAKQIAGMLQSIEDIASQTNLLALNATIEAARAGEAGKGFAVVAGEVKSLSTQTAKATDDIRKRINRLTDEISSITKTMENGTNAVQKGRSTMEATVVSMNDLISSISTATNILQTNSSLGSQQEQAFAVIAEAADAIQNSSEGARSLTESVAQKLDILKQA